MRQSWWDDEVNSSVKVEKQFFQLTLTEQGIYDDVTVDDVKYFFFSLPSIIIVKGYAFGFTNQQVKNMISQHIQTNRQMLKDRKNIKIQFTM